MLIISNNKARFDIIDKIENKRNSKVIVYFTGDRQNAGGMIAEDAVEPLYNNLINLEFDEGLKKKTIDLFLYSRGGNVSVPWKIAAMIREFCDEFNVLIPYKAYSATTLLALGADCIIMGKKGELGPIDPTLEREEGQISKRIPVEDVNSYISFIREKANINDQAALATMIKSLVDEITPLVVGNVNRQNSHIRLVARKLLTSRNEKMDEEKIDSIIETLTEKMYYHGHGIGRKEAKEIGLPITNPKLEVEDLMWDLYMEYRNSLELDNPIFPDAALGEEERTIIPEIPVAIIESKEKSYKHKIDLEFTKQRKIPPSPQINVNVNLQLPPEIPTDNIPTELQQILQDLINQVAEQSKLQVQEEIVRQSPLTGLGISLLVLGGKSSMHEKDYGTILYFTVKNKHDGSVKDLDGYTVKLLTRLRGVVNEYPCVIEDAENGLVSYTTEEGFLPTDGTLKMQIRIYDDEGKFTGEVHKVTVDPVIDE